MDLNKKLSSLQEISKAQLSKIFATSPSLKHIILEPKLIRPLERVCGVRWLKDNGVEKIFKLESATPNFGPCPVFYMIFAKPTTFKQVIDQIRSQIDQENPIKNKFHVIVVPRVIYQFEEELEQLGLVSIVKLYSFQWLPIHLDAGILSMEFPSIYKTLYLQHEYVFLPTLSRTLWNLSLVIGKPRFILTLGQYSEMILKQFDLLEAEKGETDRLDSDFGALIIMDRSVDYPGALLTPGTYSALLNEVYKVSSGVCEFKESDSKERLNIEIEKQPVSINLDSGQDPIYADIKNRYFTEVTSVLSTLTKQLKSEKVQSKEMALDEIKHYVQTQLQATKSRKKFITNHLLAAETIINVMGPRYEVQQEVETNALKNSSKSTNFAYLEEILCSTDDKFVSLRLFCLMLVTQKPSESEIKSFWKKFIHHFGYKYSFVYRNLVNANFIQEEPSQNKIKLPMFITKEFYSNANKLKQIPQNPDKIDLKAPTCASYVFGGNYIPVVTQIASLVLNSTPVGDIKMKLEGLGVMKMRHEKGYPLQSRTVLIFVVGGVTYAEIGACNLLEVLTGSRIVLLSDKVVSGNDLMEEMLS